MEIDRDACFGLVRVGFFTTARLEMPLPAGDAYFLVAGSCDWGDTPPGRDSFGRPRPAALDRCH